MITIESIRAVVYNPSELNDFTGQFMHIPDCEYLCYSDEKECGRLIDLCREKYASKEVIVLKSFQGRLFQMCPGSPGMICCNYRLVNTGFNCLYNCAYCYLQVYLNSYGIQLFTNMNSVYDQLKEFLDTEASKSDLIYRIGSGEFTDSLMIDDVSGIGGRLIETVAPYKNTMLELKTKSDNIDHLLGIKNKGNTVLGWSVNTPHNVRHYEEGAATLKARLHAARRAAKAGYYIAFHFDPIIVHENWQDEYARVIDLLFEAVPASQIAWISLGTFRYIPLFKDVMRSNFPEEQMSTGEFFPVSDGKYRYQWNLRSSIYSFMVNEIRRHSADVYVYMCMETERMWEFVFAKELKTSEEFEVDFSDAMKNFLKHL